jgi:hypothetical protein
MNLESLSTLSYDDLYFISNNSYFLQVFYKFLYFSSRNLRLKFCLRFDYQMEQKIYLFSFAKPYRNFKTCIMVTNRISKNKISIRISLKRLNT